MIPVQPTLRVPAPWRALLAALALFACGLLPVLGAAHSHAGEADHQACQLCEVAGQVYAAPAEAEAPVPEPPLRLLPVARAAEPVRTSESPHDSRGPPSA